MAKSKLVIGLDMDGIFANLHQAWLNWYNKTWNDNIPLSKLQWDLKSIVKKECGDQIYNYLYSPDIYKEVDPIPGSLKAIKKLIKIHDVIVITHPAGGCETVPDKARWLKKYLPELPESNYMFVAKKYLTKFDVFVDDSPNNIVPYREAWPDAHILTIAWPYNECVESLVDLRANSYKYPKKAWKNILEYIMDIT